VCCVLRLYFIVQINGDLFLKMKYVVVGYNNCMLCLDFFLLLYINTMDEWNKAVKFKVTDTSFRDSVQRSLNKRMVTN